MPGQMVTRNRVHIRWVFLFSIVRACVIKTLLVREDHAGHAAQKYLSCRVSQHAVGSSLGVRHHE